jgi:hypothetical protein
MADLAKTFDAYVQQAIDRIGRLKISHSADAQLAFQNPAVEIATSAEDLEGSPGFRELVHATREMFRDDFHSAKGEGLWKWSVQTFFRRSGFYTRAGAGVSVDSSELFSSYCEEFRRRESKVRPTSPRRWPFV